MTKRDYVIAVICGIFAAVIFFTLAEAQHDPALQTYEPPPAELAVNSAHQSYLIFWNDVSPLWVRH